MSALSSRPLPVSQLDPTEWVTLDIAAQRLGKNEGSLRRLCLKLAPEGLAVKVQPREGNAHWMLNRAYDPALADEFPDAPRLDEEGVPVAVSAMETLERATAAKREQAETKAHAVCYFREWKDSGGNVTRDYDAVFLPECARRFGVRPSRSSLYGWDTAAAGAGDFTEVAAALLDGRVGGSRTSACDLECWELFEHQWLDKSKPSIESVWRRVRAYAEANGKVWPSKRRVQQLVKERITTDRRVMLREGVDAFQRLCQTPINHDPNRYEPGEHWESDHTPLDCFVRRLNSKGEWVADRPSLTSWLDWRSRMVVGWNLTWSQNADSIRAALLNALHRDDVSPPKSCTLDNGKDFAAREIAGLTKSQRRRGEAPDFTVSLLAHLGIQARFARPYNHNGKGRIERSYGGFHEEVCKRSGSYCGAKPGDVDPDVIKSLLASPEKLPTIDQIKILVERYFLGYNARADHRIEDLVDPATGQRLAPYVVYQTGRTSIRTIDRSKLRLLEHRFYGPYKVSKNGVNVRIAGRTHHYRAEEIRDRIGTDRMVYISLNHSDLSTGRVFSEQGAFLAIARSELHDGTDREALRSAINRQNAERRAAKRKPDIEARVLKIADLAARERQEREIAQATAEVRERMPDLPRTLRLVRSPLDGQAGAVEAAERRLAAGGEGDPVEPVDLADLYRDDRKSPSDSGAFDLCDLASDDDEDDDAHGYAFTNDDPDELDDPDDLLGALVDD